MPTRWQREQDHAALVAAHRAARAELTSIKQEFAEFVRAQTAAWSAAERAFRAQEQRIAALERALARGRRVEPHRVPIASAARQLGVSRDHALRLARRDELLDLLDMREPGAAQALYTVAGARIDELLEEARATRTACLADPDRAKDGRRGSNTGKE